MNVKIGSSLSPPVRYVLGVILTLAFSLWVFYMVMHPPINEIGLMAVFLSITAVISVVASYGLYRSGVMDHLPTIRLALLAGYALSSILTFINVWLTARLMFASQHDLLLATVLLVFAGAMAMALGYFLSSALTDRIARLDRAARAIARGDLDARVPVKGKDELSILAGTFNQMAGQLQTADIKQRELDNLRRDLIAWVGHDLQTPLASIRAIVEALADGIVEDPETVSRYLTTARKDIRSLSLLIDDLFQMAQMDAGGLQLHLERNSLSDLISDTLESFSQLAAERSVELVGVVDPEVDPVTMDAQRVGRVLNNLLGNAVRHVGAGGHVEVRAQSIQGGTRVEVRDNGPGIPEEDLPLIFDRFYRGEKSRSRSTGGAGLGLAIAKGIIEAHDGAIGCQSQPGDTRFYFVLPGDHGETSKL